MRPLVETKDDARRLREIALGWVGTPWVSDGAVKGVGVSCTMVPQSVLSEYGAALPEQMSRRGLRKDEIMPAIVQRFESDPQWIDVGADAIQAGDVLLFDFGIGHLGLALNSSEILHCLGNGGTTIVAWRSDRVAKRFVRAWRPLKTE